MTILQLLRQGLGPVTTRPAWPELLRSGLGAGLGLAVAGVLVGLVDHWFPHSLFLFAPLGATAVLVFAVPSSPLAQPWNCVVGNSVAALYTLLLLWAFPALSQTAQAALAMGGFSADEARKVLNLPEHLVPECVIAVGKRADASTLPDDLREREVPSDRKPLAEVLIVGAVPAAV